MSKNKQSNEILKNFKLAIVIVVVLMVGGGICGGIAHLIEDMKSKKRDEQLDEVLNTCSGNEDSIICKKLQKDYNITFKYCKSIADSIEEQYSFITLPNGQSTMVYNPIWHAIVWEGASSEPPNTSGFKIYHSCSDHAN